MDIRTSLMSSRHGYYHPRLGRVFNKNQKMIENGILYSASQKVQYQGLDHTKWSQVAKVNEEWRDNGTSVQYYSPRLEKVVVTNVTNPWNSYRILIQISSRDYRASKYRIELVSHDSDSKLVTEVEYNEEYQGLIIDLPDVDKNKDYNFNILVYAINSL